VAWAAHLEFGERVVKEYAGTGVRSFPLLPVAIHAIFYRLAGSTGFILADLLIVVLYACLLRQFLIVAEVGRRAAELLSLAVIAGAAAWFIDQVAKALRLRRRSFICMERGRLQQLGSSRRVFRPDTEISP
jgi:hypothetical protein